MAKKETKEKSYNIKVPVYTTTMLDQTVGLFENVSYNDMIQMIKGKLSKFSTPISSSNRNKTKQTVINGITCHDITIEDVPALLLQISAFNTNMYEDNIISILIIGGESQFEFSLTNKMKNSIKIVWDEASFVGADNMVSKIIHKGVKYMDANNSQPATTIPGGASVSELIAPSNRIKYSDGWYQQPLISNKGNDSSVVGKTVKVLLPIEINGVVNEYVFCFTVGWKFSYPEYQD